MNTIEFRVSGPTSPAVANELAALMKAKFDVDVGVKPVPPAAAEPGTRVDPAHAVIVLLELVLVAFHAYQIRKHATEKERDRLITNWTAVVAWAGKKLPTTVRAVIGPDELLLHEADPERLHNLTENAARAVTIVPE